MRQFFKNTAIIATLSIVSYGCVDDKYDLSDIDTTSSFKVKDLVVPVNIDAVTLNSVLDLKEGEAIEIVNGQYAVIKTGDFSTDGVNVEQIDMSAPNIASTSHTCPSTGANTFDIIASSSGFSYSSSDVTDCIVSIEEVGTVWNLALDMTIDEVNGSPAQQATSHVTNLQLILPKGLTLEKNNDKYDPKTGLYKAGNHDFVNGKLHVDVNAISVNAALANLQYDYASHTVKLEGQCAVNGGSLTLNSGQNGYSTIHITTAYTMSPIRITDFTGQIKYEFEEADFSEIDLSSLPDFLAQEGTDIRLVNPQIYLSMEDPLNEYQLTARTGMNISAYDSNGKRGTYSLDAPGYFDINTISGVSKYQYCLSPSRPDSFYIDGDTKWVAYSALSNVLSGDGVPSKLSVDLNNPSLPTQHVEKLKLSTNLGQLKGTYTFYAPLSLADGSMIAYTGIMDGWSTEDLDDVTITSLTVTADAISDLPVDAILSAFPIDKQGHRIPGTDITSASLKASSTPQHIEMTLTGTVRELDGLQYIVKVDQADSKVLTPQMSIRLENVRARVSGDYTKKL